MMLQSQRQQSIRGTGHCQTRTDRVSSRRHKTCARKGWALLVETMCGEIVLSNAITPTYWLRDAGNSMRPWPSQKLRQKAVETVKARRNLTLKIIVDLQEHGQSLKWSLSDFMKRSKSFQKKETLPFRRRLLYTPIRRRCGHRMTTVATPSFLRLCEPGLVNSLGRRSRSRLILWPLVVCLSLCR